LPTSWPGWPRRSGANAFTDSASCRHARKLDEVTNGYVPIDIEQHRLRALKNTNGCRRSLGQPIIDTHGKGQMRPIFIRSAMVMAA
jgi:hypothetical protein